MVQIISRKILHQISLVLQLLDDFTGKPLTGSGYQFFVDDILVQPLRKSEGFFVLHGIQKEKYVLTVQSPCYCDAKLAVDVKAMGSAESICMLRLIPGMAYALPAGATFCTLQFLKTQREPAQGLNFSVLLPVQTHALRYVSFAKKDKENILSIQNPSGLALSGQRLALFDKKAPGKHVMVTVLAQHNVNTLVIDKEVKASAEPGNIKSVRLCQTDARGLAFLPLAETAEQFVSAEILYKTSGPMTQISLNLCPKENYEITVLA